MVFFVIMAVGVIVISSKLKKIQAEIKAHGLTKEDRAELTKNSKAVNKTKFKIVAVMLIIVMLFVSMIGGGSSNSSSNSSSCH
jgi:uncharacterized membrane protein